jgi:hypothetical protein
VPREGQQGALTEGGAAEVQVPQACQEGQGGLGGGRVLHAKALACPQRVQGAGGGEAQGARCKAVALAVPHVQLLKGALQGCQGCCGEVGAREAAAQPCQLPQGGKGGVREGGLGAALKAQLPKRPPKAPKGGVRYSGAVVRLEGAQAPAPKVRQGCIAQPRAAAYVQHLQRAAQGRQAGVCDAGAAPKVELPQAAQGAKGGGRGKAWLQAEGARNVQVAQPREARQGLAGHPLAVAQPEEGDSRGQGEEKIIEF